MSTTLPNSPMMLDSTGRSIVQKLQGIIDALGGGGGGDMVMPPEYDPELEDPTKGYFVGQYVTYNESLYRCITDVYVSSGNPAGAFDDTKWTEITDLFNEFFQFKPGRITALNTHGEIFNDYTNNQASYNSHAEGSGSQATGGSSHCEGNNCRATGYACHAEGSSTNAGGENQQSYCHAEGSGSQATGYQSHAEGFNTLASGNTSHAEGYYTKATDYYSHAEGNSSEANASSSHVEGYYCKTYSGAMYSHAEGYMSETKGTYAHAEMYQGKAYGYCSRASGMQCVARGSNSEASGYNSEANGSNSRAVGYYCKADSQYECAVGRFNKTYADASVLATYFEGNTYSYGDKVRIWDDPAGNKIYRCTNYNGVTNAPATMDMNDWTVDGEYYNQDDTLVFAVGNGTSSSEEYRSNAIEVYKDGRIKINGKEALALDPPTTDGTYTLQCTVSQGVVTYAWV